MNDIPAVISVRHLVHQFGKVEALRGLDFEVAAGAITGLIGNNGAGKTTAMHVLMGFLPMARGEVLVLGDSPLKNPQNIRRKIGFFAERDQPYAWMKVRELFKMGPHFYPDWDWPLCRQLTEKFGIDDGKPVKDLSKGMVAKVKLIFAFVHHPQCLILDEPTSGLDPGSRHEFLSMLRDLTAGQGITTLFSSHNLEDIAGIADHLVIIHEGCSLFNCSIPSIRDELGMIEIENWTGELPSSLFDQIVTQTHGENTYHALVRNRNSPEVSQFLQSAAPFAPLVKTLSVTDLFLCLTSGVWGQQK